MSSASSRRSSSVATSILPVPRAGSRNGWQTAMPLGITATGARSATGPHRSRSDSPRHHASGLQYPGCVGIVTRVF